MSKTKDFKAGGAFREGGTACVKMAKMEKTYPGRVVDKLVRDRMLSFRRDAHGSD